MNVSDKADGDNEKTPSVSVLKVSSKQGGIPK